jgi:hypothetical protein
MMVFGVPERHIRRVTFMMQRVLRWERQKRCYDRRKAGVHGREDEEKRRHENAQTLFIYLFLELSFLGIFKINK